jgi:Ser/Thr protein kinase RdoA (MazF antagonist)
MPRLDPLAEVAAILDGLVLPAADLAELRDAYARLRPVFDALMAGPCQPLHGDAHPGNVLSTPAGPRWTDFEEAAHGPVGWDLACLASRLREEHPRELEAALDAYGREHVRDLEAWLQVRALVVAAWSLSLACERGTDIAPVLARWRARWAG